MKVLFTILAIFIMYSNYSQVIVTDRPDQTESSIVIPKGSFQVESGFLLEQQDLGFNKERSILLPTSLFRIGVLKGFELRIVSQYHIKKTEYSFASYNSSGFDDIQIGFKLKIFNKEDNGTKVALLQHFSLPTGGAYFNSTYVGSSTKLLVSHTLTERLGVGYNLGYNYMNSDKGDFNYSFALAYGISDKLSIYIESYGSLNEMENFVLNMDGGLAYLVKDNFQLDFSFGTGVNYNMNYLSLGFSVNVSKDD